MSLELILNFSATNDLTVRFESEDSEQILFESPLGEEELQEVRWYLECYSLAYMADVDDARADRIAVKLPMWGKLLFEAAFRERSAIRLFDQFLDSSEPGRVLTVQSVRSEILALPWELLHQPRGAYLFNEKPRISVRRNLPGIRGGRKIKQFSKKETLRLLMVVSRPTGAGFIDPRSEAQAVLDAIGRYGAGRIEVEFLRPGTMAALEQRLEDRRLPAVDILHFDGHGCLTRRMA